MKIQNKYRGFTIIELLVVVTIIILLTGIIINSLAGARAKARDAQRVSDLGQLQLALALFVDRCGQYPTTLTLSNATGCPVTTPAITLGSFIGQIPTPPAGAGSTSYDYIFYTSGGLKSNYLLHTKLEKGNAAASKGVDTLNIYDRTGGNGTWSQNVIITSPWKDCDDTATSLDYCIGPN